MTKPQPHDHWAWIDYAQQCAENAGRSRYVCPTTRAWTMRVAPPPYTSSHWRIDPNGEVWAHVAEPGLETYDYQRTDWGK